MKITEIIELDDGSGVILHRARIKSIQMGLDDLLDYCILNDKGVLELGKNVRCGFLYSITQDYNGKMN